ncbi:MAG: carbamoyltransferase HypF [bacterium]
MKQLAGRHLSVYGVVQGVGFRPFIYKLAKEYHLNGWVLNTSSSVEIEIEGKPEDIEGFISDIKRKSPPLARIEKISIEEVKPNNYSDFVIKESKKDLGYQLISPDIATCDECLKELFSPNNRRYLYPFINCTNCGPRFTIIKDIPYDRKNTTMERFKMCKDCEKEYGDPMNRRFHAQPNACPVCGPKVWLEGIEIEDPISETIRLLKEGMIVAIKGLGGFHLACDATNNDAVKKLRERKHRPSKPFAVMMKDIETVRLYCELQEEEERLMRSPQCPIVLLRLKDRRNISTFVAPNNNYLGVMLPYTPLQHIILREFPNPLIMTSGNLSEEPICQDNDEAIKRLKDIAEYFLLNNRDIYSRYDDSVVSVVDGNIQMIRRARGYAPSPIKLPFSLPSVLACGGELKNTFCLTKENYAFVSQHIGDLENIETLKHFINTIELYKRLFRIEPKVIACDMHPDYLSTRYAQNLSKEIPVIPVQHHYAHVASCMAENGLAESVIGIAMDGSGYGLDGNVWGGEFMIADYSGFSRIAHFEYLPMPGGELAIRKPYRLAIGYLYRLFGEIPNLPSLQDIPQEELDIIKDQVDKGINTPITSSLGRLFDAVSSILNVCKKVDYEGQAAVELEMIGENLSTESHYKWDIERLNGEFIVKIKPLLEEIVEEINKVPIEKISAKFHNTIALIILDMARIIREESRINSIVISGGCFQNKTLLRKTIKNLEKERFKVFLHSQVPCNDGGISLGQAVVAGYTKNKRG